MALTILQPDAQAGFALILVIPAAGLGWLTGLILGLAATAFRRPPR